MPIFGLCIFSDLPSATVRIDIRSLEDGGVYFNMFLKYMHFLDGIRLCRSSGKRLLPPSKEVHHVRPSGLGLGGRGWSADLRPRMVPPPVSVRVVTHSYASTSPTVFGSVGYHQPALSVGSAKGSCATDSFVDMDARRHAIHLGRQPVCRLFEASRTGERWHALPTSVACWLILLPA
jgi:hypothetical protein